MAGLQTGGRDEPEVLAVPTLTLEMPSNHGFVWAGRLARRCQSPSGDSGGPYLPRPASMALPWPVSPAPAVSSSGEGICAQTQGPR